MMNEPLGKLHFVMTFIGTNLTFLPMHELGLKGMPRRVAMYDPQFQYINIICTVGAFLLGLSVLPFIINAVWSWRNGPKASLVTLGMPRLWNGRPPRLPSLKTGMCCPCDRRAL
jgi:cytochrome c oxidase subunit 1